MKTLLYGSLTVIFLFAINLVLIPSQSASASDSIETKLTSADGAESDRFGWSVAASDDTVVVGAWMDDDNGSNSGSAYVFTRSGTVWMQQAKLTAADAEASDVFGYSVAVSGDTIVVGAYGNDDSGSSSGSAYVFTRNGTAWTEQQKLAAADAEASDVFGISVAISEDTVVVGAWNDEGSTGSAYVFERSGIEWTQQTKLTATDGAALDYFGCSVAVSGDTVVVGSYQDDDNGDISGSAYVFTRSGIAWTQQKKLTAADGAAGDYYGGAVAISGDTVVVGSSDDDDNGDDSGSAYVYTRSGTAWTEQAKLISSDGAAWEYFGSSVGINGNTLAVGAPLNGSNDVYPGSAYIYTRSGITWTQQRKLTAIDGADMDFFGQSLGVSGATVTVGAFFNDDDSGSAYVFEQPPDVKSINITSADRDETLDVIISGIFFDNTSAVSFGTGVMVNSYTVDSSNRITANITVSGTAALGARDVAVTTPVGIDLLSNSFMVEEAPAGWVVEFLPGVSTVNIDVGGGIIIPVDQNLFVEQTPVYTVKPTDAPSGQHILPLPNRFGPDTIGYTFSKRIYVRITPPANTPIGISEQFIVNAKASYLGQTGAAEIGQTRPFTFTVNTVLEFSSERPVIPFDWNRWLPVIIAVGIGVVVVGIVYIPRLIAKGKGPV
ncbi:MAG: hypothetical protein HN929_04600 [Chloroflexi bacterium]|nr:hypothetical protein [Chloroflexota bacterium]MBT7080734.1 hypothetical protein [Chloroflexota bacterium]MBT7290877.1 hypothetical protein [Chloroflexota bacterium]